MIPEQVWTEYICLYCAEQVRRPDMFGCEEVGLMTAPSWEQLSDVRTGRTD